MKKIDLKTLLEKGAHFGHKTNKWHPSAKKFIYKSVGDIHIIDLTKTKKYLEKACEFIYSSAKQGKVTLFVGTKRQASTCIREIASSCNAPYIATRWIGGLITNWEEIKKNIDKLNDYYDKKKNNAYSSYTKRERMIIEHKMGILESLYGGIRNLEKIPDVLYIVDVRKEKIAISEAQKYQIPIVAIVDTNTDNRNINYIIPANDDAVGSIQYITECIGEAYKEGREVYTKNQKIKNKKTNSN